MQGYIRLDVGNVLTDSRCGTEPRAGKQKASA